MLADVPGELRGGAGLGSTGNFARKPVDTVDRILRGFSAISSEDKGRPKGRLATAIAMERSLTAQQEGPKEEEQLWQTRLKRWL